MKKCDEMVDFYVLCQSNSFIEKMFTAGRLRRMGVMVSRPHAIIGEDYNGRLIKCCCSGERYDEINLKYGTKAYVYDRSYDLYIPAIMGGEL